MRITVNHTVKHVTNTLRDAELQDGRTERSHDVISRGSRPMAPQV